MNQNHPIRILRGHSNNLGEEHSGEAKKSWVDSWHLGASSNKNYDYIDGLRGLAILMVIVCHFFYFKEDNVFWHKVLQNFSGTLGYGVMLFFTLSGFLISWPFWKSKAEGGGGSLPRGYGWRRFWKIYPPLALSVLLLTPLYIGWRGDAGTYFHAALLWLTGAAFFVPVNGLFNPVMWSLVVEIHFYLILPLLFFFTRRLSARTCLVLIPAFMLCVPLAIQYTTGVHPLFAPEIEDPFCTGLASFFAGVALAGTDNLKIWKPGWSVAGDAGWFVMFFALLGMAWVRTVYAGMAWNGETLLYWLFIVGTGCLLCYGADLKNPRVRWLCLPWLRWLGVISYELYLFHQPMIGWSRYLFGGANKNVLKYAVILGVPLVASLLLSAAVYRWFSLPLLRYGRSQNPGRPR